MRELVNAYYIRQAVRKLTTDLIWLTIHKYFTDEANTVSA